MNGRPQGAPGHHYRHRRCRTGAFPPAKVDPCIAEDSKRCAASQRRRCRGAPQPRKGRRGQANGLDAKVCAAGCNRIETGGHVSTCSDCGAQSAIRADQGTEADSGDLIPQGSRHETDWFIQSDAASQHGQGRQTGQAAGRDCDPAICNRELRIPNGETLVREVWSAQSRLWSHRLKRRTARRKPGGLAAGFVEPTSWV